MRCCGASNVIWTASRIFGTWIETTSSVEVTNNCWWRHDTTIRFYLLVISFVFLTFTIEEKNNVAGYDAVATDVKNISEVRGWGLMKNSWDGEGLKKKYWTLIHSVISCRPPVYFTTTGLHLIALYGRIYQNLSTSFLFSSQLYHSTRHHFLLNSLRFVLTA